MIWRSLSSLFLVSNELGNVEQDAAQACCCVQDAWGVLSHWQQQGQEAQTEPMTAVAAAADQTAVVAALSFWDYSLLYDGTAGEAYKATGRCFSVAAGRISYVYGLKGTHLPCGSLSPKQPVGLIRNLREMAISRAHMRHVHNYCEGALQELCLARSAFRHSF